MIKTTIIFILSGILSLAAFVWAEPGNKDDGFQKVNFLLDFSDYNEGSVEKWLRDKGFEFKRDARNRKKLDLDVLLCSQAMPRRSNHQQRCRTFLISIEDNFVLQRFMICL